MASLFRMTYRYAKVNTKFVISNLLRNRTSLFLKRDFSLLQIREPNVIYFNPKRSLAGVNSSCWNCEKNTSYVNNMFCEHCKTLREPDEVDDHFSILDTDKKYSIDLLKLSKTYKSLQMLLHPDKFTNRPRKEQDLSLEWSSRVNKAYSILHNPLHRAEYLLENLGLKISEESETGDTEFLMEMMARNEEISEINTAEEASKSLKNIQQMIDDYGTKLGKLVDMNDLKNALQILRRMKYFYSLEQSLKNKATNLADAAN